MVAVLLLAAALEGPPTAETLMAAVVANAQNTAQLRHACGLTGSRQETTVDIGGAVEKVAESKTFRLEMSATGLLQQLVFQNGIAVHGGALEPPDHSLDELMAAMQEHYTLVMASPGPTDGYYVIAFEPKDPDRPAPNEKGVVINHMSGIVYVDKDRLFVRRVNAWLKNGFSRKLVGRVQEASAQLDQELLEGMPVPRKTVFTVRYSRSIGINILGLTPGVAQRTTVEYSYDPLPLLPSATPPAPSP